MLQYLIKFSISLAVLFIFYRAVLRPLTFYQCNRFYLLGYSLLSFVIPFIDINPLLSRNSNQSLVNIIPSISYYNGTAGHATTAVQVSFLQRLGTADWLLLAFCAGAVFMLVRLVRQYLSLRHIRRTAVLLDAGAGIQLYETSVAISPFSFGNAIYFNRQLHTEEELQRIIQHEFVHVKQQHTIDLLVGELLCVVNWFNPFAWLIRHGIRQNLEFIADNNVVTNGLDKKEYQYLLLKCVGVPQYSIANNFNFSSLKKRIAMMNKMKTSKLHLTKFLFVLPLLAVLFLAFRKNDAVLKINPALTNLSKEPIDTIPNPPPPPVEVVAPKVEVIDIYPPEKKGNDADNFENITIRSNTDLKKGIKTHIAIVTLKNGTKEKYNLNNPKEKAVYIEKYGVLPAAAPPPPAPPVPVISVNESTPKTGANPPQPLAPDVIMSGGDFNINNYQHPGKPPLYIIDGKEMPANYKPDDLNGTDIKTINVWKEKNAVDKYGASGKNGVIEIMLKPENERGKSTPSEPAMIWKADKLNFGTPDSLLGTLKVSDSTGSVEVAMRKNSLNYFPKDVLIVIDGREIPSELNFGTLISPENIERMTVMKGNAATALYGEKARNGAIIIISKAAKPKRESPVKTDTTVTFINKPLNRTGDNRTQVGLLKKHDAIEQIPKTSVNPGSYIINGKAKSGTASEISLGAFNVPKGSVSVSAGGSELKEGIDYSIDYALGIVKILNQAIVNARVPVTCNLHRKNPVTFNFGQLTVAGSIVTSENESAINGSFSFAYTGQAPLVIVDGAEMTGINSFKAKKGNYKMLTLGATEAIVKYGDRAKYGALEITTVKNNGKA